MVWDASLVVVDCVVSMTIGADSGILSMAEAMGSPMGETPKGLKTAQEWQHQPPSKRMMGGLGKNQL